MEACRHATEDQLVPSIGSFALAAAPTSMRSRNFGSDLAVSGGRFPSPAHWLITLQVGEERIVASAGMFVNMPVGTPHSFKNESGKPAKMLISVAPAGLEQMFFEIGVPVAQGATTAPPPSKVEIEKLLGIAPKCGIEIRLPGH